MELPPDLAEIAESLKTRKNINGYILWSMKKSKELKNYSFTDVGRRLGEMWRAMSLEEKQQYKDQATLLMQAKDKQWAEMERKQQEQQQLQQQQQQQQQLQRMLAYYQQNMASVPQGYDLMNQGVVTVNTNVQMGAEVCPIEIRPDSPDMNGTIEIPDSPPELVPQPSNCTLLTAIMEQQAGSGQQLQSVSNSFTSTTESVSIPFASGAANNQPVPVMLVWAGQQDISSSVGQPQITATPNPAASNNQAASVPATSTASNQQLGPDVQNLINRLDSFIGPEVPATSMGPPAATPASVARNSSPKQTYNSVMEDIIRHNLDEGPAGRQRNVTSVPTAHAAPAASATKRGNTSDPSGSRQMQTVATGHQINSGVQHSAVSPGVSTTGSASHHLQTIATGHQMNSEIQHSAVSPGASSKASASTQLQTLAKINQSTQGRAQRVDPYSPSKDVSEPSPLAIVETTSLGTPTTQTMPRSTASATNTCRPVVAQSSASKRHPKVTEAIDLTEGDDDVAVVSQEETSLRNDTSAQNSPPAPTTSNIGTTRVEALSVPAPMSNQAGGQIIFGFKQKVPRANGKVTSDYLCNFCETAVPWVRDFLAHVLNHIFVCTMCNFQSFQRADVITHVMSHHPELLTNFPHLEAMHMSRGIGVSTDRQANGDNCLNFIQSISKLLQGEADVSSIPTSPCFPASSGQSQSVTVEKAATSPPKSVTAGSQPSDKPVDKNSNPPPDTVLLDSDSDNDDNDTVDLDYDTVRTSPKDADKQSTATPASTEKPLGHDDSQGQKAAEDGAGEGRQQPMDTDELEVIAEERRDTCSFCFYKELHESGNKKTLVGKDTPKLVWGCPYCDESAPTMEIVKAHVAKAHSNKPVDALRRCPVCYARKGKVDAHKQMRAKCTLYQCPFCGRLDKQRNLIIRHINFVHVEKEFNTNEMKKVAKPELSYEELVKLAETSVSLVETVKLEHTEKYPKLKQHTFSYDPDLYDDGHGESDDDDASITTTSDERSVRSSVEAKQKPTSSASTKSQKTDKQGKKSKNKTAKNQADRSDSGAKNNSTKVQAKRHASPSCDEPPAKLRLTRSGGAARSESVDKPMENEMSVKEPGSDETAAIELTDDEFVCSSESRSFLELRCKDCDNFIATSLHDMKNHFIAKHQMKSFLALDFEAQKQRRMSRAFFCYLPDCSFVSYGSSLFLAHMEVSHPDVVIPIDILCRYMISQKKKKYENKLKQLLDKLITDSYHRANHQNASSQAKPANSVPAPDWLTKTMCDSLSNAPLDHGAKPVDGPSGNTQLDPTSEANPGVPSVSVHRSTQGSQPVERSYDGPLNISTATQRRPSVEVVPTDPVHPIDLVSESAGSTPDHNPQELVDWNTIQWYKCLYCKFKSSRLKSIRRHVREIHNQDGVAQVVDDMKRTGEGNLIWLCRFKVCNFFTRHKQAYQSHTCQTASEPTPTQNGNASLSPVSKVALPSPDKDKLYKCHNCSFESKRVNEVRLHLRGEHAREGLPQMAECVYVDGTKTESWFCRWTDCSQVHHGKHAYLTHLCCDEAENQTEMQYKCYYCSYLSVRLSNVRRHLFITHKDDQVDQIAVDLAKFREGQDGLLWLCPQKLCTFWDSDSATYYSHECPLGDIAEPSKDKKYQCIHCDYMAVRLDALRNHLRRCHLDPSLEQAFTDSSRLAFGAPSRRWFCIARKCLFVAHSYDQYLSHECDTDTVASSPQENTVTINNKPTPAKGSSYVCFHCKKCCSESLYEIRQHLFSDHGKLRPIVLDMVKDPAAGCALYLCSSIRCAYASYNPRETHTCMPALVTPETASTNLRDLLNIPASTESAMSVTTSMDGPSPPIDISPVMATTLASNARINISPMSSSSSSGISRGHLGGTVSTPSIVSNVSSAVPINISPSGTASSTSVSTPNNSFLGGLLNAAPAQVSNRLNTLLFTH